MPSQLRKITEADILSDADYAARRKELRTAAIEEKRHRRIEVGPFVTFHFENYSSMWLQVQEMLRIEKGGPEQIAGELEAYNPLIPQGSELIATMMIEVEDPVRRNSILLRLGGIEEHIVMDVAGERVKAVPAEYGDRTTPDGKTSSVHWLRFSFTSPQIAKFRGGGGHVLLGIEHPNYGHIAVLPPAVRAALAKDFA